MVALISHTPTNNWTINLTTDILKWVSMKHNRLRTNFDFFTIGDFILYHNELLVSCYFSCWKDEGIITHAPFLLLCNFPFQTTPEEETQPCLSFYSYSMQVSQIHIFYVFEWEKRLKLYMYLNYRMILNEIKLFSNLSVARRKLFKYSTFWYYFSLAYNI